MQLEDLIRQARTLWCLATNHDGIDPNESFVEFSDDNPYLEKYKEAVRKLQFVRKAQRAMEGF